MKINLTIPLQDIDCEDLAGRLVKATDRYCETGGELKTLFLRTLAEYLATRAEEAEERRTRLLAQLGNGIDRQEGGAEPRSGPRCP